MWTHICTFMICVEKSKEDYVEIVKGPEEGNRENKTDYNWGKYEQSEMTLKIHDEAFYFLFQIKNYCHDKCNTKYQCSF